MSLTKILGRAVRMRCPNCGGSNLFESWMLLKTSCEKCACEIRSREDDTWFFMYMTTAGLTGLYIAGMLLFTPRHVPSARWMVAGSALVVFVLSQPLRK